MGLSLDIPINFDVLLINTFITQLPVVFGELGRISLAGVFERRFVISVATFELWLRDTIAVFLGMIWGTDRCFVNNTLYSHTVSFQRAVFRFITVAGTWWGYSLFVPNEVFPKSAGKLTYTKQKKQQPKILENLYTFLKSYGMKPCLHSSQLSLHNTFSY